MRRFALLLLLAGCEPELPKPGPDAGPPVDGGTPLIVFTPLENGASRAKVNAMSIDTWASLDLDQPAEVPFDDNGWDLAFQRFHIRSRGGASGTGGVEVAIVRDAGFDDVTQVPDGPWLVDLPDGDDDNADLDTVFERPESWFSYDPTWHTLTPYKQIYVVKSDQGAHFKVQLEGYYDSAGTPANLTLRFGPLP